MSAGATRTQARSCRSTLVALAVEANHGSGEVRGSAPVVAERAGVTLRTWWRHTALLEAAGMIARVGVAKNGEDADAGWRVTCLDWLAGVDGRESPVPERHVSGRLTRAITRAITRAKPARPRPPLTTRNDLLRRQDDKTRRPPYPPRPTTTVHSPTVNPRTGGIPSETSMETRCSEWTLRRSTLLTSLMITTLRHRTACRRTSLATWSSSARPR